MPEYRIQKFNNWKKILYLTLIVLGFTAYVTIKNSDDPMNAVLYPLGMFTVLLFMIYLELTNYNVRVLLENDKVIVTRGKREKVYSLHKLKEFGIVQEKIVYLRFDKSESFHTPDYNQLINDLRNAIQNIGKRVRKEVPKRGIFVSTTEKSKNEKFVVF